MLPPIAAALSRFLAGLRYPTLFKLCLLVAAVSWLWPFDPLPFVDEILSLLLLALLARWKQPKAEPLPKQIR